MASHAPTIQDHRLERDRLTSFGGLVSPAYFGFLEDFLGPCEPTDADWQFYNIHKVMRHDSRLAVPDDVDMMLPSFSTDDDDDDNDDNDWRSDSDYGSDYDGGAERVFIHSYAVSIPRQTYVVINAQLVDERPGRSGPRLTDMRLWEMIQANWAAAPAAEAAESSSSQAGDHSGGVPVSERQQQQQQQQQQQLPLKYLVVKLIENQASRDAITREFEASLAGTVPGGVSVGAGAREQVVVTEGRSVAWRENPFTRCACRVAGGAGRVRAHLLREDASLGAAMDMFVELDRED